MSSYYVYWVRRSTHTNVKTEGYVGITSNIQKRLHEHKSGNSIVSKALKKYDDITVDILSDNLSLEQALETELNLRPSELIGWNICTGGGIPPSRKNKSCANTKITLKGEARTERQKQASQKLSEMNRGRVGPNIGKTMSAEQKEKISRKLKGRKIGPPNDIHRHNLSLAALSRPLYTCEGCSKQANKAALARHHKKCVKNA